VKVLVAGNGNQQPQSEHLQHRVIGEILALKLDEKFVESWSHVLLASRGERHLAPKPGHLFDHVESFLVARQSRREEMALKIENVAIEFPVGGKQGTVFRAGGNEKHISGPHGELPSVGTLAAFSKRTIEQLMVVVDVRAVCVPAAGRIVVQAEVKVGVHRNALAPGDGDTETDPTTGIVSPRPILQQTFFRRNTRFRQS